MKPVQAWLLFVAVFLAWHVPAAFQWAALHHVMVIELGSVFLAAVIFWSAGLGNRPCSTCSKPKISSARPV